MPPIVHLHLPAVTFRLSQLQWQTMRPGLVSILVATQRQMQGISPSPHVPLMFPPPRHGMFWTFFADVISNLWVRSYKFFGTAGRCRFRADLIEISLLALAARARHNFVPDPARYIQTTRDQAVRVRLLQRLKNIRRRAALKAREQLGQDSFRELMKRWNLFSQWLKFWALKQKYASPVQRFSRMRCRRFTMIILRVAQDELKARNIDVPPDSELRPLVRAVIRECRRQRNNFAIRTLIEAPIGHDYLVRYITKRLKSKAFEFPVEPA